MADPIMATLNWNVIEGAGLAVGALVRKFRGSGLSVAFHNGRVGAFGLDFFSKHHDPEPVCVNWSFVLKVANPNKQVVSVENVSASWRGGRRFYAETAMVTIKMLHPKPMLPDDGDESLPLLVPAGGVALFTVECLLSLYTKRWFIFKKSKAYTKDTYGEGHPKNLRYTVKVKTNHGQTALKS